MQFIALLHRLANAALNLYEIALIVYFLLSWFPNARGTKLWDILYRICEPYVGFFRQFIPPIGGISFAGMVALFVLILIGRGINALFGLLYMLFI